MKVTNTVDTAGAETVVLTPQVYNFIKKLVQIVLPAFSVLYLGLSELWGFPAAEKVVGSVALLTTFLGVLIGITGARYASSDAGTSGEFVVTEDGGGASGYRLVLNADPEQLANQEKITFKVHKVAA